MRGIKAFTSEIEAARVAVKAPVLDLGKRIDTLARELTSELEAESDRIGRTLGAWQAEERRKVAEAERRAREEEQRIWREAQEKERAEKARIAKEETDRKAAAAAEAKKALDAASAVKDETERARRVAEVEQARIQAEIEADQRAAAEADAAALRSEQAGGAMVAVRVAAQQVTARKPAGVATRTEIVFE